MRCFSVFVLGLAILFAVGCSDGRTKTSNTKSNHETNVIPEVDDRPIEERRADAFFQANEMVEMSRIRALPLKPLVADKIQGVALPLYAELPYLKYDDMLKKVVDVGASHVSIVISWEQRTIFHNTLGRNPDLSPSDERIEEVLVTAKKLGLKTMVFPIVHIEQRNTGEWRGKLAPTDMKRWKAEYRKYILTYAKMSARTGVDLLSIGSELSSLESDTEFWTTLAIDVRKVFKGELVYSSNWDHYKKPKFWGSLDYIGVSSYFEVAKHNNEPIETVTARWDGHRKTMEAFSASVKKPLILTEAGYPSIDSAAVKPWDYTAVTPPNQNAQLAAFRSLAESWNEAETESFGGLFIWHGWGEGGPSDTSYAIWDKTAYGFVKHWYSL